MINKENYVIPLTKKESDVLKREIRKREIIEEKENDELIRRAKEKIDDLPVPR